MFDFLRKRKPRQEEPQPAAKKPKKAARQAERDKHIENVMKKTGWDRKETVDRMKAAKKAVGISYKDYDRHDFFTVPEEDQDEIYQNIQERKERRRANQERREAEAVARIMVATSWDHDTVVERVKEAQKRTGCTYKEYLIYRFYELTAAEQDQVFVARFSRRLSAKYDVDPGLGKLLANKEQTNEYFAELVRRPWCVNTKISLADFTQKFARSESIFYQPLDGSRGRNVEVFAIKRDGAAEVFNQLVTLPEGVVEECVVQHPDLNCICPTAVNTIRVVTISSDTQPVLADGRRMDVAYATLRLGGGSSSPMADYVRSGGMVAGIDLATGTLVTDAADLDGHVFANHPLTGTTIRGFRIPCFQEAIDMVTEAIRTHHIQGYLGWDIAITENGPALVSVSEAPSAVMLSMPYAAEKQGMKRTMKKYL